MIKYNYETRVRFCDTDKMQFMHHATYIQLFESARTEMLRHYDLAYKMIEDLGYEMPVVEVNIKYKNPALYDDLLVVECKVSEIFTARVHIDYKVYKKETGQLCAEGYTKLVFAKDKKATKPPLFYIETLQKHWKEELDEYLV